MTHLPNPSEPDQAAVDPQQAAEVDAEVDVVPGVPPVPITVWRTPADDGQQLGYRFYARLLAAYSHPGDLVYDTTGNPLLRQAAAHADRRYTTTVTGRRRGEHPTAAALAVCTWPPQAGDTLPAELVLAGIRRRLQPGGILAAVTTTGAGQADVAGLVDTALAAGLCYLQHIVAVNGHTDGDHLTPPPDTGSGRAAGHPRAAHLRVHADLYLLQAIAPPAAGKDTDAHA